MRAQYPQLELERATAAPISAPEPAPATSVQPNNAAGEAASSTAAADSSGGKVDNPGDTVVVEGTQGDGSEEAKQPGSEHAGPSAVHSDGGEAPAATLALAYVVLSLCLCVGWVWHTPACMSGLVVLHG